MRDEEPAPRRNGWGQPIGTDLREWHPPARPTRAELSGVRCRLEPLDAPRHAADLWSAWSFQPSEAIWTYLPYGPFPDATSHAAWIEEQSRSLDPLFFAVIDQTTGRTLGWVSWLRITPEHGVIELGHLVFSPALQRTPTATEALFLMMREAFQLGYRRLEWKCDSLNAPSRAAAERLGFRFEGVFRQAIVYRGRNRDTAWYSVVDREWPELGAIFERWLSPDNFDAEGRQRLRLSELTRARG